MQRPPTPLDMLLLTVRLDIVVIQQVAALRGASNARCRHYRVKRPTKGPWADYLTTMYADLNISSRHDVGVNLPGVVVV